MDKNEMISKIYEYFVNQIDEGKIPVDLRPKSIVGTVQDDPFDCWVEEEVKKALPQLEVLRSGSLTTPDIIIRDRSQGDILGIEVKKLIQNVNGADPRGLTMDYNSCLPCGSALIRLGKETVVIPCFYLFALLSNDSKNVVTSIFMDGDFLNYDFNLHKKAKFANISEYNHGPYGEGSVRHRMMYTYPNPLNYKLKFFHLRHIIVAKKQEIINRQEMEYATEIIIRDDVYNNSFYYFIIDKTQSKKSNQLDKLPVLTDIFRECKKRKPKDRTISMPCLSEL